MTPKEAKNLIKKLGLTGVGFAELMGKSRSYVSDFNTDGVPENIAIILTLSLELKEFGSDPISIIKNLINHG
ncbi:MAG: hypothetical protein COB67_02665 [SAR324 cluster bacterium]|uniref:XRE family transcriptional regulator n=1 Tax=SAR324 cluster bacterium TaxID=2024889 RepID=A0A2A4T9J9_9DELT|nr:MAG: hypothetical protein COB67_02665 [SAR324 cluster bacterium]